MSIQDVIALAGFSVSVALCAVAWAIFKVACAIYDTATKDAQEGGAS